MITKEKEYRSEIFKIAGFSLMAPLGRIFLQPLELFREYGIFFLICYATIALALFFLGIILIAKGHEHVEES